MNLTDYVRIFLRRWWIIGLLVVLSVASAYVLSKAQTPVYRASQTVLIQPSRIDFGLAEATTRLMRSYVVYLNSNDRAREVIDALQLDMLPAELRGNVTIDTDESSLALEIDVDLPDGDLAVDIARQWGILFERWRNEQNQRTRYEDRINVELIDVDVATYSQIRPSTTINVIAGAVLGLLLGGIIVFVLEYMESNVIRGQDDVTRSLDMRVLGAIPSESTRS
jgi:capsular polysaccharide biosynthesis protein